MRTLEIIFEKLTATYERRVWFIGVLTASIFMISYYSVTYIKNYNLNVEWSQRKHAAAANGQELVTFGLY